MMGDNKPKGSIKVLKQPNTRQTHLNVGSTYSMGLEPKLTPCSEGSAPIHPIIHAHSCRQGGPFKTLSHPLRAKGRILGVIT